MLALARAYLRTYPEALRFHSTHVLNHRGSITWNRNPLLGQYPGAGRPQNRLDQRFRL